MWKLFVIQTSDSCKTSIHDQIHISALNVHECSLILSSNVIFAAELASSAGTDDAGIAR